MASDWIKMRTDLYRDPKVCCMADILMDPDSDMSRFINQHTQADSNVTRNVIRNAVVGALVSIWGIARVQGRRIGDDLALLGALPETLDDIADLPGIGDAMKIAGWVKESDDGLIFPRFFELHNEDYEDQQKKNRVRQARFREKQKVIRNGFGDVTVTPSNAPREEKSREENKEKTKAKKIGFVTPTLEEVRAYCVERANSIDPAAFVDFYTANGWVQGRGKPIKDWKACVRTWETNEAQNPRAKPAPAAPSGDDEIAVAAARSAARKLADAKRDKEIANERNGKAASPESRGGSERLGFDDPPE